MWRSLFLALGIMLTVVGAECLVIDSAALHAASEKPSGSFLAAAPTGPSTRNFTPSEWFPWSIMGAGTLTILYALTLRRSAPAEG
ncbi:hypothetical protein [Rosistilla oblonga]|uniref:Uncharacterized protein n=1 Tax=Rosistilla oblonga TaxID=2527990 RepID=A0A518IP60_9BACT|nr:hypothetical protein [Rosistilla oblonga]QDV54883.1 hypothetical protein Mal33_08480 [Rosistilla oblonga]